MDKSSINTQNKQKNNKFTNSALWIISAAAIMVVCLIFFIITICNADRAKGDPKVFDVAQAGATHDSLLISWDCTVAADEYIVNCTSADGNYTTEITSDIPFASVSGLIPDSKYTIEVIPVKNGQQYSSDSTQCNTAKYCEITAITIDSVTSDSVTASWQYSGINNGFTAIAYVTDIYGKRHLTSAKVEIPAGGDSNCTITGLVPEMKYTFAVIPNTRFNKLGKLNFETQFKSTSSSKINIIRAVICPENTQQTKTVTKLTSVKAGNPYKISMMISGVATAEDTVNMVLYINNSNGQLVSETHYDDIHTNPNGLTPFTQRIILLDFKSPEQKDEYTACLTIDGEFARRINFDTFSE